MTLLEMIEEEMDQQIEMTILAMASGYFPGFPYVSEELDSESRRLVDKWVALVKRKVVGSMVSHGLNTSGDTRAIRMVLENE